LDLRPVWMASAWVLPTSGVNQMEVDFPGARNLQNSHQWAESIRCGTYEFVQLRKLDDCFILCFPLRLFSDTGFGSPGGLNVKRGIMSMHDCTRRIHRRVTAIHYSWFTTSRGSLAIIVPWHQHVYIYSHLSPNFQPYTYAAGRWHMLPCSAAVNGCGSISPTWRSPKWQKEGIWCFSHSKQGGIREKTMCVKVLDHFAFTRFYMLLEWEFELKKYHGRIVKDRMRIIVHKNNYSWWNVLITKI
jgi:hypothetical protein